MGLTVPFDLVIVQKISLHSPPRRVFVLCQFLISCVYLLQAVHSHTGLPHPGFQYRQDENQFFKKIQLGLTIKLGKQEIHITYE